MDSIRSDTLVSAIKDTLVRFNVKLTDCCGQCYDGASNMSGSRRGVTAQICGDEKKAPFSILTVMDMLSILPSVIL